MQEAGFWWYGDFFDYDKTYLADLKKGLRKAGVPEGPPPEATDFNFTELVNKVGGTMQVEGTERIDPKTAKSLWDRGVPIVDVRDGGSYGREHIAGAVHINLVAELAKATLTKVASTGE